MNEFSERNQEEGKGDPLKIKIEIERELSELTPQLKQLDEDIHESRHALESTEKELGQHIKDASDLIVDENNSGFTRYVESLSEEIASIKTILQQLEAYRMRLVALMGVYAKLNIQVDAMMTNRTDTSGGIN